MSAQEKRKALIDLILGMTNEEAARFFNFFITAADKKEGGAA